MALTQTQVENAKNLSCEKCGCEVFTQTYVIKHISALLTNNGKDMMAPVPIFSCSQCKHVNNVFVQDLKIKSLSTPEQSLTHVQV